MTEPTPRQVLYALVAGAFLLVAGLLTIAAAAAALVPAWWTVIMAVLLVAAGIWMVLNWRRTAIALLLAIGLFIVWAAGTLIFS